MYGESVYNDRMDEIEQSHEVTFDNAEQKWFRVCPTCNEKVWYSDKRAALSGAKWKFKPCKRCKRGLTSQGKLSKTNLWLPSGLWYDEASDSVCRACPGCGNTIFHSTKNHARVAYNHRQLCAACGQKKRPPRQRGINRGKNLPSHVTFDVVKQCYIVVCPVCHLPHSIKQFNRGQKGVCKKCATHPSYRIQTPDWMAKRFAKRYKPHPYTFPSGKTINVQGYEGRGLDYLLNVMGVSESDIVTDHQQGMPRIAYVFDGKKRYYFPDVYVKSRNLIVEVKSLWTHTDGIAKNKQKMETSFGLGYNVLYLVYEWNPKKPPIKILAMNH